MKDFFSHVTKLSNIYITDYIELSLAQALSRVFTKTFQINNVTFVFTLIQNQ